MENVKDWLDKRGYCNSGLRTDRNHRINLYLSDVLEEYKTELLNIHNTVMQWVSVDDRLPETNCDVLVTKKNGMVLAMSYHAPFDSGKMIFQWWGFGKWVDQHRQVTHWMYMPKPHIA